MTFSFECGCRFSSTASAMRAVPAAVEATPATTGVESEADSLPEGMVAEPAVENVTRERGGVCKGVKATIATSIYDHLERYVTELQAVYQHRDMRGLYQHLKRSTGLSGRQDGGQQFVTDENGVLLRNKDAILKR